MNSHSSSVVICIRNVELEVEYKYFYEASVHTYSNGDPGHPESSELEIRDITKEGKEYSDVLLRYDKIYPKEDIFGEIEDEVYDKMDDSSDDDDIDYEAYLDDKADYYTDRF